MLLLQFAIGSANDLADRLSDTVAKPGKPIPAGLLTPVAACVVVAACVAGGLAAAAFAGTAALALAFAGLIDGLVYDLRLKGTALSGVPFALGVAILPAYAWYGATGSWPPGLWGIVVLAAPLGFALSLANGLVDLERDRLAGTNSVSLALGPVLAWRLDAGLTAAVAGIVTLSGLAMGGPAAALLVPGLALQAAGLAVSRASGPLARERGWELQVAGGVALASAWVWLLVRVGALGG
jgi:4-hydroxybenzoate polyprenyltransferase